MTTATIAEREGERRKLGAHALLAARRESLVLRGRRALLVALLERDTATADDVRAAVPIPENVNPVLFGVVPGALARAGIIRRVGFTDTMRATAHARSVAVWQLRDRAAALKWLAAHPEPPNSPPADGLQAPSASADAGPTLFEITQNETTGVAAPVAQ